MDELNYLIANVSVKAFAKRNRKKKKKDIRSKG